VTSSAAGILDLAHHGVQIERGRLLARWKFFEFYDLLGHEGLHGIEQVGMADHPIPIRIGIFVRTFERIAAEIKDLRDSLMFAISSCRREKTLLPFVSFFRTAATGKGRKHDHETTVDHSLIRGLVTAGPVMRRGASSVYDPASDKIRLIEFTRVPLAVIVPPALPSFG
jgi:hypothetical protein